MWRAFGEHGVALWSFIRTPPPKNQGGGFPQAPFTRMWLVLTATERLFIGAAVAPQYSSPTLPFHACSDSFWLPATFFNISKKEEIRRVFFCQLTADWKASKVFSFLIIPSFLSCSKGWRRQASVLHRATYLSNVVQLGNTKKKKMLLQWPKLLSYI